MVSSVKAGLIALAVLAVAACSGSAKPAAESYLAITGKITSERVESGIHYLTMDTKYGSVAIGMDQGVMPGLMEFLEGKPANNLLAAAKQNVDQGKQLSIPDAIDALVNVGTCLKVEGVPRSFIPGPFYYGPDNMYLVSGCK